MGICDPRPIILCHDNTIIKEYISKSLKKIHIYKKVILFTLGSVLISKA